MCKPNAAVETARTRSPALLCDLDGRKTIGSVRGIGASGVHVISVVTVARFESVIVCSVPA